jgi:hypothetical protein
LVLKETFVISTIQTQNKAKSSIFVQLPRFDDEAAALAMNHVNHSSIAQFLQEFTQDPHHRVGSKESESFADYIVGKWKEYRLEKVEIDRIYEMIPRPSKIPSEIRIRDEKGTVVWSLTIPELEVKFMFVCLH